VLVNRFEFKIPFISSEEVERITDYIQKQKGSLVIFELPSVNTKNKGRYGEDYDRDELFVEAARLNCKKQGRGQHHTCKED